MDKTDNYQRIADAIDFLRARHPYGRAASWQRTLGWSHRTPSACSAAGSASVEAFRSSTSERVCQQCMARTGDMLHLSLASGMSGPGRLHDLFVNMEAMSPGEFKAVASGIEIRHGIGVSPVRPGAYRVHRAGHLPSGIR